MKKTRSKIVSLLWVVGLTTASTSLADSIYVAPNTGNGWNNYWAPGNYYYPTISYDNTQNIGVYTGNAWVEASWGVSTAHNPAGASYSFNGVSPVTVNQTQGWGGQGVPPGLGAWSGFGGPGAGIYSLTAASTLAMTGVNAISETRVTPITGTIVTYSSQLGINAAWTGGGSGMVGVSNPGGDGYRYAIGAGTQYYYYQPGLVGTFDLQVSWGMGNPAGSTANWYLDPNGTGNVGDYVSLLNFNSALFSDGVDRNAYNGGTYWGQWSGFKDAAEVTLNASSRIVYENPNFATLAGAVSDLQLTPVPEPGTVGLLGLGAGLLAWAFRKRSLPR